MSSATSRRFTVGAAIAGAVAVVVAVGIGWLLAGPGADRADRDPAAVAVDSPPASGGLGGTPSAPPPADPADPAGPAGPADPAPATPDDPAPEPDGPRVEQFEVVQQPRCPGGTDQNPIEGQPVTLQWQVTGAEQVTLSVDGPGVYGTYPAEGGETLPFPCEGGEGDTQQHTYLLTATGDGVTVTETLVVTATVHDRTDV